MHRVFLAQELSLVWAGKVLQSLPGAVGEFGNEEAGGVGSACAIPVLRLGGKWTQAGMSAQAHSCGRAFSLAPLTRVRC